MRVLERLAAQFPLYLEVIRDRQVSHNESLEMKRRAHIVIDECVTGSYHRNSLEGLAVGSVVVNGVGSLPSVVNVFRHCTEDVSTIPFVRASLEDLENVLKTLTERGGNALATEGESNRRWMERHWDFEHQWNRFWIPVIARAFECNGREVVLPPSPDKGLATTIVVETKQENSRKQTQPVSAKQPKGVSVVIPHGGSERLALLAATIPNLRRCKGIDEIIVVEMDERPYAFDLVRRSADRYVFVPHCGIFRKARAINVGIPFADSDLVLWLDNDLISPEDFV
jgi:hypothetical protein